MSSINFCYVCHYFLKLWRLDPSGRHPYGDLRGLGMTLPAGLLTPTIRLGVGEDGSLIPRG